MGLLRTYLAITSTVNAAISGGMMYYCESRPRTIVAAMAKGAVMGPLEPIHFGITAVNAVTGTVFLAAADPRDIKDVIDTIQDSNQ